MPLSSVKELSFSETVTEVSAAGSSMEKRQDDDQWFQ